MKRRFTVFVLVIALFTSLNACSPNNDINDLESKKDSKYTSDYDKTKYNEPGTLPIFKNKQTITVTLPSSAYVEDFNTNYQTTLIEKELNADLQITAVPSKEYKTKIGLMFASSDSELGDAIMGSFTDGEACTYAGSKSIVTLTDYFYNTSIAYYLNTAKERVGIDYFPQITMADGEIYGIPSYSDSISNPNPDKMFVYMPWLDKLGLKREDIKTPEDFKNLMIKFRDTDLNGNGLKDEIPTVQKADAWTWFNYLMNPFIYAGDKNYMVVNGGDIYLAYQQDGWKDGLRYIKELYDENLISHLTFTQDSTNFSALLNNETTVVGSFCALGSGGINATDPRRGEYIAISPLEGKDGKALASFTPTVAKYKMLINAKAADPESVFRLGDLMTSSELSICTAYGEKGVDYLVADPSKDKSAYAELGYAPSIKPILVFSSIQNKHWYQTGPYIREKAITAGVVEDSDAKYSVSASQMAYEGHNPDEYITKLIFTNDERSDVESKMATLLEYVNEMSYNFISGKKDIDADWDEFQDQLELIGSEDVLVASQAAFERMEASYK